ncbi:MAG TPA: hypothetical protein PKE66_09235, partial [Pyrinomonadaceae bacterium]|nr:hypothetical protein [Pyrinomonadaceae bacterium]
MKRPKAGRSSSVSIAAAVIIGLLASINIFSQVDPNPNSPVPVLLSQEGSTRALAEPAEELRGAKRQPFADAAFPLNAKVNLYVTNIDLMEGEGANAFRVYLEDSKKRQYRVPVVDLQPSEYQKGVYRVTIYLRDELGFWEQPAADGDVLVRLTWRGLSSNRVRLGLG